MLSGVWEPPVMFIKILRRSTNDVTFGYREISYAVVMQRLVYTLFAVFRGPLAN